MVGHVEQEDLRGADQQRGLDPRRIGRQAAFEQSAEQMPQRAEPAQHGRDDAAHQRAVALGERGEAGMACASSSCSSSGRRRRSTPSRISAAMRRAARPGGCGGMARRAGSAMRASCGMPADQRQCAIVDAGA